MPRTYVSDEVRIMQYFETAPIEKALIVYDLVSEKMRQRRGRDGDGSPSAQSATRRQPRRKAEEMPAGPQAHDD